jgi:TusA-related sulfurtransferase
MSLNATVAGRAGDAAAVLESAARCIVERHYDELQQLLAPEIRLRALLPHGPEEHDGADQVVACVRDWFEWAEDLRAEKIFAEALADRWLLAYRFTVGEGEERRRVAQQCVCDVEDGLIARIDLVCTGYRPDPVGGPGAVTRFDAGDLGCADGLADEFRRRIRAIPVGSILEVLTSDPAAKEDLPPLARMMGNTVHGVDRLDDGRVLVTVERNK